MNKMQHLHKPRQLKKKTNGCEDQNGEEKVHEMSIIYIETDIKYYLLVIEFNHQMSIDSLAFIIIFTMMFVYKQEIQYFYHGNGCNCTACAIFLSFKCMIERIGVLCVA